ncbi:L,D-transpeptidase family protein [Angustibacter luteus]|uniref:L,D-transpeptidase n=1 Tax=Angustibacter luteus TaxID=658456 RepID=A0ABW1JFY0_9ACTN
MTVRRNLVVVAIAGTALLTGCADGGPEAAVGTPTATPATSVTTTPSATPTPSATATATPTRTPTRKPSPVKQASPRPTKPRPKPHPKPAAARCSVPSGVSATQVVLVTSSGSSATVRACRRSGSHYVLELGPYSGHVGKNGVSASKREGDLRTPAGVFPLRGGFGANGNPGLATGSWLRVDAKDVWVDDSSSSLYNTHQRTPASGRWDSAEKLLNTPAYGYAQVIGYNEARTPGRGSAIFFHVDLGHGTAGCVSLPTGSLLRVMRWERAGAVMAIR